MHTENPVAEAQRIVREMSGDEHAMPLISTAAFDWLNAAACLGLILSGLGLVAGLLFATPGSDVPGFSLIAWSLIASLAIGLLKAGLLIVHDVLRLLAAIAVELRLIRRRLERPAAAETDQSTPPPGSTSPSLR